MKKWTKVLSAFVVATVMSAGMAAAVGCDGCDGDEKHQHNYTWVDNGDGTHKEHCGVEGCDAPDKSQGSHTDTDKDGKCDVCNATVTTDTPTPVEKVTVTFMDGETAYATRQIEKGGKVERPDDPTKQDHVFGGWFTGVNGTGDQFDFETAINADTTLYAKWTENGENPPDEKVTVTFVTGDGASTVDPQEIVKGGKVEKPANPTKDGSVFDGWFTDSECKNAFDFDTEIQADTPLYAKWRTESIFDTLSARADNIVSESFLDKTKEDITVHGSAYGTAGVFVDTDGVYDLASGALIIGGSASTKNIGAVVDFGIVSGTVEGYFEFTMGDEAWTNGNSVNFYNQNNKVLEMIAYGKTTSGKFIYKLNGVDVEGENAVAANKDTLYKVEFKFDLEAKKLTLKINGTAVFTDKDSDIGAVTGFTVMTSNSGKRTNKIDCIAVCGTSVPLADYKADLTGGLEAKLAAMTDETNGTHKLNAAAVTAACTAGKTAVSEAADHAAVFTAYNEAVKAMNSVAGDIQQAAINYVETQFPAQDYTVNKSAYDAEIAKIIKETDATKLVVPDGTVEAGATLQAALTAIDAIDDDATCFYKYCNSESEKLSAEFAEDKYKIKSDEYQAVIEEYSLEPDYSDYESYEAAVAAIDTIFDNFRTAMSAIKTDETVIGEYAAAKGAEITEYKSAEITALEDEALKTAISGEKESAIAALATGVIEKEGYADAESADYYITVIDGKVAAVKESIDDKIAMAGKTIDEVKTEAVAEFNDFVTDELSKVLDSAFVEELKADTEAPALNVADCTTAGEVTTVLDSAKTAYGEWLAGKLAAKEYTITVNGNGVTSPVTVKVKYGASISAADVKDPTAGNPNLMVADGNLYTDSACENVYDATAKVYADNTLYVKIVDAVLKSDNQKFEWVKQEVDGVELTDGTAFNSGANLPGVTFLTVGSANSVVYKSSDKKDDNKNYIIINKNGFIDVVFVGTGTLKISLRGTSKDNEAQIYLQDSNGINCTATGATASYDGNIYGVKGQNHVTVTFKVDKPGTYKLGVVADSASTARVSVIEKVDGWKVPCDVTVTFGNATNKYYHDDNITVPEDPKTGNGEFVGWYKKGTGEKFEGGKLEAGTYEFEARYEYTVKITYNDGNENVDLYLNVSEGSEIAAKLPVLPANGNLVHSGWKIGDDGEKIEDFSTVAVGSPAEPKSYTFVAVYEESTANLVTSITVTAPDGNTTVSATGTLQLTATVNDDADEKSVTWASSDESVATVDQTGLVTAKNTEQVEKTVTITVTANDVGAKSVTIELTIEAAPATTKSDLIFATGYDGSENSKLNVTDDKSLLTITSGSKFTDQLVSSTAIGDTSTTNALLSGGKACTLKAGDKDIIVTLYITNTDSKFAAKEAIITWTNTYDNDDSAQSSYTTNKTTNAQAIIVKIKAGTSVDVNASANRLVLFGATIETV